MLTLPASNHFAVRTMYHRNAGLRGAWVARQLVRALEQQDEQMARRRRRRGGGGGEGDDTGSDWSILDVGGGAGVLEEELRKGQRLGGRITVIDRSRLALELLQAKRNSRQSATAESKKNGNGKELALQLVACESYTSLPTKNGEFDAIVALEVLPVMARDERRAAVREWARCLRPGGVLVVGFDAPESQDEVLQAGVVLRLYQQLTPTEVANLLKIEAGLESVVTHAQPHTDVPYPISLFIGVKRSETKRHD